MVVLLFPDGFAQALCIGPEQNRLEKSISSETLYTCNRKGRSLTLRRTAQGIREWSPIPVNNLRHQDVTPYFSLIISF